LKKVNVVPDRGGPPSPSRPLLDEATEAALDLEEAELVTERYADGAIKSQRWVTLDEHGDFVNHGAYKAYDREGNVLGTGEYRWGEEFGKWTRYFTKTEGTILAKTVDKGFEPPYVSEVSLKEGQLDGAWTIRDRAGRIVLSWEFKDGVRHGTSTWYYSTGQKRSEVTYQDGKMHGDFVQWDENGRPSGKAVYFDGRRLTKKVDWHAQNRKLAEGWYLDPPTALEAHYDWWNGVIEMAPLKQPGKGQKHGKWTYWYPNGKTKMEGEYRDDLPVGTFTWWYSNGQKQTEGQYVDGLQNGIWTGWHPNGMKKYVGKYHRGQQAGHWMVWNPEGKRVEVHDYGLAEEADGDGTFPEDLEAFEETPLPPQQTARPNGPQGPALH